MSKVHRSGSLLVFALSLFQPRIDIKYWDKGYLFEDSEKILRTIWGHYNRSIKGSPLIDEGGMPLEATVTRQLQEIGPEPILKYHFETLEHLWIVQGKWDATTLLWVISNNDRYLRPRFGNCKSDITSFVLTFATKLPFMRSSFIEVRRLKQRISGMLYLSILAVLDQSYSKKLGMEWQICICPKMWFL